MKKISDLILIRNVGLEIEESDIHKLFEPFGVVSEVIFKHDQHRAFLKMEDINASVRAVQYYNSVPPTVRGRNMSVRFVTRKDVEQSSLGRNFNEVSGPQRVLRVFIHHAIRLITVNALYEVFKTHGAVEKIITFEAAGIHQALIQYQSQEEAMGAFDSLHGRCMYDGCCQLSIKFAEFHELDVHCNNNESWDFTDLSLATVRPRASQMARAAVIAIAFGGILPSGVTGANDCCTIVLSNLNPYKIDEDKLFNLFSLYGKVVRIKNLPNKRDNALVEMEDGLQAELAAHYLKGATLFGKKMELDHSKEYPSSAPSQEGKSYFDSIHHRFNKCHAVKKYRYCCAPTKMLYISHLPAEISEDAVRNHMSEHGLITKMKLSSEAGWTKAHILFNTEEEATEALVSKHGSFLEWHKIQISFSNVRSNSFFSLDSS